MSTGRLRSSVAVALVLLVASAASAPATTYVLPVVVKGTRGLNGSFWDSEVRILLLSLQQDIVVRRLWVAVEGGGFVDDPGTAPAWSFPALSSRDQARMIVLKGSDLLQGVSAAHAAVALDIPGSVAVYLHNVNSQGAQGAALLGSGQLTPGSSAPFIGPVTIPWSTAGEGSFRMSVGFVNPSANQVTLRVFPSRVLMATNSQGVQDPRFWLDAIALQPLVVVLPPWGWHQVDDIFSKLVWCTYASGCWPVYAGGGYAGPHVFEVQADDPEAPYFTYASMIYSPLNDPEFVAVIPGSVGGALRSDFPCPPSCSGP
ncbi:MAG TPA: hypothetical protein VMT19_07125 [Thermoanaerobaculaceae bacterium]|nr:hypothetical protein [Thermoanaerobaculaceae bacterium]